MRSISLIVCFAVLSAAAYAQQTASFALKRFEVIRVNAQDIARVPMALRAIFADPVPDAELVDSLAEATKRVGFTARLPKSEKKPRFAVIASVREELKISVPALTMALHDAKAEDVKVPDSWDGVIIDLQQRSGVYIDFGDFFIAEAPPVTLTSRAGFPMDQFFEVLSRVLGMNARDAAALRQRFAAGSANYFPIPPRYDLDVHDVKVRSGSGLLFQNAEKVGELALAWSDADRTYFLSGLMTESQAVALANSIEE
jgi:hypothetical protein